MFICNTDFEKKNLMLNHIRYERKYGSWDQDGLTFINPPAVHDKFNLSQQGF